MKCADAEKLSLDVPYGVSAVAVVVVVLLLGVVQVALTLELLQQSDTASKESSCLDINTR